MWAIRRTSIHLKNRVSGTTQICFVKSDIASCYLENYNARIIESQGKVSSYTLVYTTRFYNSSSSSRSYTRLRTFSSQGDALKNELETPHDAVQKDASGVEIGGVSEFSEGGTIDMPNKLESIDTETDVGEPKDLETKVVSPMTQAIIAAYALPVSKVLDKWVQAGNEVTKQEVSITMINLRRRQMFVKALQLSEWWESTENPDLTEGDYASRIGLIARVRGIPKAEKYLQNIPESFRGERVYQRLLADCVLKRNIKKAEQLFMKIRNLFPLSSFCCNHLLLLYQRTNRKKINDVLLLMDKENVKRSIFTYQILIDAKGEFTDISGTEEIVQRMKSEGVEPDMKFQASLARNYAACGLKDKAEAVLKSMEGGDVSKNLLVSKSLLSIYASLGRDDEVGRIWKLYESNPRPITCMAAIEAWGRLNRIEDAEAIFDKMMKIVERPSSRHYADLLNVYINHNMLAKAENLIARMEESGVPVTMAIRKSLLKLYVAAGEVEKADAILDKGPKQKFDLIYYLKVLDIYSSRGDVQSAEKVFVKMRQAGYTPQSPPYQSLLYAYINANAPAHGFAERLKADNVVPDKALAGLLARANAVG